MIWSELPYLVQETARTVIAVSILVALVLIVRRPFARHFGAKAAYALWLLPLIRFVMPPLPSNWALSGWLGFGQQAASPEPFIIPSAVMRASEVSPMPEAVSAPSIAVFTPPAAPTLWDSVSAAAPLILTAIWLAGVCIWLGRSFYQQRQFLQLIEDDSEAASPDIMAKVADITAELGLKRQPNVRASLLCSGPLVTGLKDPVVLLPLWFEEDYTRGEQRDALVHEMMHLRRRDLWAFQVARIVAATQWFNPLAHIALHAFRTDQEAACDSDVLAQPSTSPAAYGATLVKAARLARPSDRRLAVASLTLAHPIKERLIMMTHPKPTFRSRLFGTALAGTLGAAAIFATASTLSAQADETKSKTFVMTSGFMSDGDRQMVLLSDPFADVSPKLDMLGDVESDAFSMKLDLDFEGDIADIAALEGLSALSELEGLEALSELEGLEALKGLSFSSDGEDGASIFVMRKGESEADFELRIEDWADDFEAKAEAWAEKMEERSNVMSIRIERHAEKMAEKHEAKAEAWAAKIEATFDDEFDAEIDAASDIVSELADKCDARDEGDPTPEIVRVTRSDTGEVFSALCVNGEKDRLKSDALADWVAGRNDLSDAEKAAFAENRDTVQNMKVTIGTFDHEVDTDEAGNKKVIVKRIGRTVSRELKGGED